MAGEGRGGEGREGRGGEGPHTNAGTWPPVTLLRYCVSHHTVGRWTISSGLY